MLQETQRTPDYWSSLRVARCRVDSSLGSFFPVPPYFCAVSVHRCGLQVPNDLLQQGREFAELLHLFF